MNSFSHSSACLVVESDRKNEAVKVLNFTTEGGGGKKVYLDISCEKFWKWWDIYSLILDFHS